MIIKPLEGCPERDLPWEKRGDTILGDYLVYKFFGCLHLIVGTSIQNRGILYIFG